MDQRLKPLSQSAAADQNARAGLLATLGNAAAALGGAFVTGFLLLINGSFVLVFLHSIIDSAPEWFRREGVLQFALFVVPLMMVVAQWMIWDMLRGLFSARDAETDPWTENDPPNAT